MIRPTHDKYRHRAVPNSKKQNQLGFANDVGSFATSKSELLTIGDWASRLKMRPSTLIGMFTNAGVRGLTPKHVLEASHTKALFAYVRSERDNAASEVYSDNQQLDKKLLTVQSLNNQLLQELARTRSIMHQLDPRKFEEVVAKILEDQGCNVNLTKRTRDGGYDIFGSITTGPTEFIFLAECKRYAPEDKVGIELVRNLYGVTEINKANQGLLITSSSFTRDALQEKIRIGPRIGLKDFEDLKIWLDRYKNKD